MSKIRDKMKLCDDVVDALKTSNPDIYEVVFNFNEFNSGDFELPNLYYNHFENYKYHSKGNRK